MAALELELLKEIFKNKDLHICIGKVLTVIIEADRSAVRCKVEAWPDRLDLIATMTWDKVSDGGGDYQIPDVGDMVLIAFAYGQLDYAYIIKSLSSKEDRVPAHASTGDRIIKSRAGKKTWLTSDTRINITDDDSDALEPLVLGNVLKELLSSILVELKTLSTALATHSHASNGAPPTLATPYTNAATAFDALKADPVDNNAINSDLAFTEKG